MNFIQNMQSAIGGLGLPTLFIVGIATVIAFYFGKTMKFIKLPSIIGFMLIGVLIGPSLLDLMNDTMQSNLSFITEIALGFVAISIGLELKMSVLKKQGSGIILIILFESFAAFILVTAAVYLLTKNLPLALIFGAIAPASAPAGTVAVIQEYKAKGPLTEALYAVVGFDDGLGIIIFGFAAAFARSLISVEAGLAESNTIASLLVPLKEVFLSLVVGSGFAFILAFLIRRLKETRDVLIVLFAFVLVITGLCDALHLSIILINMVTGIILINTQTSITINKLRTELSNMMPLLFVMFFTLAGANLHVSALPSLGLLGVVYILSRSGGLIGGAKIGALLGRSDTNIRKYLGLGILSQAGVAIGLSLIVKQEFSELGVMGAEIGTTVITTVTATCLFFEIIGPILTRVALKKSGEITV